MILKDKKMSLTSILNPLHIYYIFVMCCVGDPRALDRKCWFDSSEQRPDIPPAEDPSWTHPDVLHPPDLPIYL